MSDFATVQDIIDLKRTLTAQEQERAGKIIPIVCDSLRMEADKVGIDFDEMISSKSFLVNVAKSVTVDVVMRELMASTDSEPMSQESQSGMGYSWSGTYLVPGGGIFIKKSELARLGLRNQRAGVIELYGKDKGNNSNTPSED